MSLYLWLLAALVIITAAVLALKSKRKPPVAGGRGPIRFSRATFENKAGPKQKASFNFRVLGLWLAVLIIVIWVGFSLASRPSGPAPAAAVTVETDNNSSPSQPPNPVRLTPIVSGSLAGPPPEGPIPPPPNTPAPPVSNAQAAAVQPPARPVTPPPAPPTAGPQGGAGLFQPDPTAEMPSLMVPAAQSMAPVISRMEPVGRSLTDNPKPRPKPQTQTASPRSTQSERPRISVPAPPISQTQVRPTTQPAAPPAQASPPLPDSRKYTVLLGAFGKQENAINLKNRLEAAGLPVSISEATENNKLWFRVMSGTFEDRNSAEAYSRELRQRKLVDRPYVRPM